MNGTYARPVSRALPDVGLSEPRVSSAVLRLTRVVSGAYLRLALGFGRVELRGGDVLVDAFRAALAGERRVILAFRHPYGDEPQLLGWTFSRGVERETRRLGVRLARHPHAVFVHGYEVPRWGGPLVRWLLPRVGAMPVHHSKMDSAGMERIRAAIEDGRYPLALSPEGQVSYTSDAVPRLEAGAVRLGFQAADRLLKAGRPEPVALLPVSVRYEYGRRAEASLERLVRRIEVFVGADYPGADMTGRLAASLEATLRAAERQYGLLGPGEPDTSAARGRAVAERLEAITEAALGAGERILGLDRGAGDAIERLYRIRQAGWDRVYLASAEDPRRAAPLWRAVLDRRAGEAWYAMRHMELADLGWYFRSAPPEPGAGLRAFVEYAQNLWDLANRLAGGAISGRVEVRPKRAVVAASPEIDLSARLPGYRADRKAATAAALVELRNAYESCIKEFDNE